MLDQPSVCAYPDLDEGANPTVVVLVVACELGLAACDMRIEVATTARTVGLLGGWKGRVADAEEFALETQTASDVAVVVGSAQGCFSEDGPVEGLVGVASSRGVTAEGGVRWELALGLALASERVTPV